MHVVTSDRRTRIDMAKLNEFSIVLSSGAGIYNPGSAIEGCVVLELSATQNFKCITIAISGEAHAEWPGNHSTENVVTNIGSGIRLLGNDRDTEQLSGGRHRFPFSFQLPSNLPSSYKGKIHHPLGSGYCGGCIEYLLTATLSRPWKFKRHVVKTVTIKDIVRISTAVSSSSWRAVERTCGPVRIRIRTDRGGYYPGESLALTVNIKNNGNRRIIAMQAGLMQSVIYYGRQRGNLTLSHRDRQCISLLKGPGADPRREINWNDRMLIPTDTVPNISNCRIIHLSYVLIVWTVGTGPNSYFVEVPIIIGSKPLHEQTNINSTYAYQPLATNSGSRPVQMEQSSTNTFPPSVRDSSSQREHSPPPSYSGTTAPLNPQSQERQPDTVAFQPPTTNAGLVSFSHFGSSIPQTPATDLSFQGEQIATVTSNGTHQTPNINAEGESPQLNTGDDQGMREAMFAPVSDLDANCNSDQPPPYDSLVIGEYA